MYRIVFSILWLQYFLIDILHMWWKRKNLILTVRQIADVSATAMYHLKKLLLDCKLPTSNAPTFRTVGTKVVYRCNARKYIPALDPAVGQKANHALTTHNFFYDVLLTCAYIHRCLFFFTFAYLLPSLSLPRSSCSHSRTIPNSAATTMKRRNRLKPRCRTGAPASLSGISNFTERGLTRPGGWNGVRANLSSLPVGGGRGGG